MFYSTTGGYFYEKRNVNHEEINARRAVFKERFQKPVNVFVIDPFSFALLNALNQNMQYRAEQDAVKAAVDLIVHLMVREMMKQSLMNTFNRVSAERDTYSNNFRPVFVR